MDIGAFITESNNTHDFMELNALMTRAIGAYGYERIIYFTELGPDDEQVTPRDFIESYNCRNLKATDPVLHLFFTHNMPFTHEQIVFGTLAPEQRAIMELHRDCGVHTGVNIPLGSVSSRWVGVTLGGSGNDARDDALTIARLYALVNQYALRYAQLMHAHPQDKWQMQRHLSSCGEED